MFKALSYTTILTSLVLFGAAKNGFALTGETEAPSILNERIKTIKPSASFTIGDKTHSLRAQGIDIINLAGGEAYMQTADHIKDAAIMAINKGDTRYTPVDGTPMLKEAIQEKLKVDNHLNYNLDEIIVTSGAKQAIFEALQVTLNPGDEVVILAPHWLSYPDIVKANGGVPLILETRFDQHFRPDLKDLEKLVTPKTKWLILNSPNNPSGSIYTKEDLKTIATLLQKHPQLHILSDEIYEHIVYEEHKFESIPFLLRDFKNRILLINGVSKSFAMTGWRIGYAAGPKDIIYAMKKIQSQSTSCPSSVSQAAATEALKHDSSYLKDRTKIYQDNRNYVYHALSKIDGIKLHSPEGAFYAFLNVEGLLHKKTPKGKSIETDEDLAIYFLEEGRVALIPGTAMGLSPYLRISFSEEPETVKTAISRIETAIKELS